MNKLFIALCAACLLNTAYAKVISENKQSVKIELASVILEVSAKCKSPKFEDDVFHVYFSDASFVEVSNYEKMGYSYKLLNKNCGPYDAKKEPLSSKEYETVQILLVNTDEARSLLDEALKDIWNSAK
ncbi:hypothetical protein K2X05_05265 [bacterium]|nr:hypothetical protein [bacterium]